MLFTLTYQSNSFPRTTVLLQDFPDLAAAIEHAKASKTHHVKPAQRVLIRMGDAAHTDPVVWDSDNEKVHDILNQAIINRVDNMLSDLASMQTRMLALKDDIHNLLGIKS